MGKAMNFSIKTMSYVCDICGKNRAIRGIHAKCSEIRKKRRIEEDKNNAKPA